MSDQKIIHKKKNRGKTNTTNTNKRNEVPYGIKMSGIQEKQPYSKTSASSAPSESWALENTTTSSKWEKKKEHASGRQTTTVDEKIGWSRVINFSQGTWESGPDNHLRKRNEGEIQQEVIYCFFVHRLCLRVLYCIEFFLPLFCLATGSVEFYVTLVFRSKTFFKCW